MPLDIYRAGSLEYPQTNLKQKKNTNFFDFVDYLFQLTLHHADALCELNLTVLYYL